MPWQSHPCPLPHPSPHTTSAPLQLTWSRPTRPGTTAGPFIGQARSPPHLRHAWRLPYPLLLMGPRCWTRGELVCVCGCGWGGGEGGERGKRGRVMGGREQQVRRPFLHTSALLHVLQGSLGPSPHAARRGRRELLLLGFGAQGRGAGGARNAACSPWWPGGHGAARGVLRDNKCMPPGAGGHRGRSGRRGLHKVHKRRLLNKACSTRL